MHQANRLFETQAQLVEGGVFLHRMQQFFAAVMARVGHTERTQTMGLLSAAEYRLFERMPLYDQRHCLDVYQSLVRMGYTDEYLLRAALIHDCGKVDDDGRPMPLLFYGLFVVLRRLLPGLYQRGARSRHRWLRYFAIHASHDARSAVLATAAGSPPELTQILRDYADHRSTDATRALHWADSLN
ncbi:MAG TPA: hypothetical protein PKA05_10385 [Roseiflexaceae bacterium]|nr:hypothetical protein [Roseiflexaceae bacterium]HMP40776.1 hypothetical protein [Roseiflexaceae bacterium]